MEKENNNLKGFDVLMEATMKIKDFGDKDNLSLKSVFFNISENKSFDAKIRDLATELMLYCEDDELNDFQIMSKEEILKRIAMITKS
jgi:hypothetical protein